MINDYDRRKMPVLTKQAVNDHIVYLLGLQVFEDFRNDPATNENPTTMSQQCQSSK